MLALDEPFIRITWEPVMTLAMVTVVSSPGHNIPGKEFRIMVEFDYLSTLC